MMHFGVTNENSSCYNNWEKQMASSTMGSFNVFISCSRGEQRGSCVGLGGFNK
ncbi:hypothetical protein ACLOJK_029234, partial [Asimina triloba]